MGMLQKIAMENKTGRQIGVFSVCTSNQLVIRAALRHAGKRGYPLVLEATSNQCNQFGGYTGMTPKDYMDMVHHLVEEEGCPASQLILGGDHLGPLVSCHKPEREAMKDAADMIRAYAAAGFGKIHIDTSMRVASDDQNARLPDSTIARRGAQLCGVAEVAFAEYQTAHPNAPKPVYVIGSEVPIPGGAQENEDSVTVTTPHDCEQTLAEFERAFAAHGLTDAWKRVIAVVVQPGVEFADESVIEYKRPAAAELMASLSSHPGLVFEGHSTDYQPRKCLREMVEDGIAILKVGPALTFALREGLFALEQIERELYAMHDLPLSCFRETLEQVMLEDKGQWAKYYHGDMTQKRYARAFSFSDRARYYLTNPKVQQSIHRLLENLDAIGIPVALLSQYLPVQYTRVRSGKLLLPRAADLLIDRVGDCIDDYLHAVLKKVTP